MLTPELKNEIVAKIIETIPELRGSFEWEELAESISTSEAYVQATVLELERKGFIKLTRYMGGALIEIFPELYTFNKRGGFLLDELTFEWQFEKLRNEIEAVKPKISTEQFNAISGAVSAIAALIGLGKDK